MAGLLNELLDQFNALPAKQREKLVEELAESPIGQMTWCPNPGPQTAAWWSEADELFYGGEAGGGKSDLLIGLATTAHIRSLVLRRTNKEADKMVDRFEAVIGNRIGWNSQAGTWRLGHRIIDIGGCEHEKDKQKRKGIPHDLKAFDEIGDFTESQYTFITAWARTTVSGQRSRVVVTGNPPTTAEGLWVTRRWAAWLDPRHPNPAKDGELRWYTTIKGKDAEVDGRGPHMIEGESQPVYAKSRTFIRAHLTDNPDQDNPEYHATLAALPEEYREAYRNGNFQAGLKDKQFQVIPSAWIFEAQKRWTETPPQGVPMTAIGCDLASGGTDRNVFAPRYDGWFAPLIVIPGADTPYGSDHAGLIVKHRRDNAEIVLDMGGGYGGPARMRLLDNGITPMLWNGAKKSKARSRNNRFGFALKRDQAYWQFREALDPDQPGGSGIALPPDSELVADLVAPCFEISSTGLRITSKDDVIESLHRSPDKGDAVVMSWQASTKYHIQDPDGPQGGGFTRGQYRSLPRVVLQKPKR